MKAIRTLAALVLLFVSLSVAAQQRRPIDNRHPLWMVHVDVWNTADPQKIIDLIPEDIRPYVCMNLSFSCQYDTERNMYKMPRCAVRTYRSWGTICQKNGLWFTCQPASGGHTHIQDDDLETFEYFFRRFPNFLGWNYAEQFWGFDESGDKSSSTQASRIALFAKLIPMHHRYGGFLTISFCGNIWSHGLNPVGMMKRNKDLLQACRDYPESVLWLYKYTTSSCFYNNESVTFGPFVAGLARNYGVRYDNCGWNGALDNVLGSNHGKKYPVAAGIGTVMEQTGVNGGAVWDGPELIWTEDFQNLSNSTVGGYTRRNWGTFPGFDNIWIDMFRKIIDGTLYIPSRQEVVDRTKVVIVANGTSGSDEDKYAAWGTLYDGLYKQTDPFNKGNGQWMENSCYFKSTGRYGAVPIAPELADDLAKSIPVKVNRTAYSSRWSTVAKKSAEFNELYPTVSEGDLYVARVRNQLVTYMPYSYLNKKTTATGLVPLLYNTCDSLRLTLGRLSTVLVREEQDHIDFYLNNFRTDTTAQVSDLIVLSGVAREPQVTASRRGKATGEVSHQWDAETGRLTIEVRHMGPFDLNVTCTGDAGEKATDLLPAQSLSTDLPRQPEAYTGPIIVEAEDMDYKSVKSVSLTNSGWYAPDMGEFAGNGFVEMGTSTSGSLRHQLSLPAAGDYTITLRYTCSVRTGNISVTVNGSRQFLRCDKTEAGEWAKASFEASLREGDNTLVLNNSSGLPIIIDQVIYAPAGTEAERFLVSVRQAEHGTVTPDLSEAAEGEQVTLRVDAEEGYQLTELRVISSVYYSMARTIELGDDPNQLTFTMPDDNVTLQPVFTDRTLVYGLDLTAASTSIPEGWRCVQGGGEVHEYPNSYSAGARLFSGFTGYQGKALYWREDCAEYGRQSAYPLTLGPGHYRLSFACAAWKGTPRYKASILDSEGTTVAQSGVCSATPNANGSTTANLTSARTYELEFDIAQAGNYVIRLANNGSGFDEFLLLDCRLNTAVPTSVSQIPLESTPTAVYDLSGRRRPAIGKGLNIVRTADGQVRKVLTR
ncbi:MAG: glycosyl hydrolase family 98 [Bacteroidaceae bacterium]|nr:glycosyl hydrolase family 98 [Bacteroidaceae bacterium]